MAIKMISFLGATKYTETLYTYQGQDICYFCRSQYVAEAVVHIFFPQKLYVFVTPEARKLHFDTLKSRVKDHVDIVAVPIATPQSDDDVWKLFNCITQEKVTLEDGTEEDFLCEGDSVILEITNAFRSIPILSLMISNYLRVIRKVELAAITYAEFVPGQQRTPIRNLSISVPMLNWIVAAESFQRFGRFSDVSTLMHASSTQIDKELNEIAEKMEQLSQALHTSRPVAAMQAAHDLLERINHVRQRETTTNTSSLQPFVLLLDKIQAEYSSMALAEPREQRQAWRVLDRLLHMIDWYLDKDLPVHAMTFAREWLVSLIVYFEHKDIFDDSRSRRAPGARAIAEDIINNKWSGTITEETRDALPDVRHIWQRVSDNPDFQQAADIRNDLAHAGMRRNARSPEAIIRSVKEICGELKSLLPSEPKRGV